VSASSIDYGQLQSRYLRARAEVRAHANAWREVLAVCADFRVPAFGPGRSFDENRQSVWFAGRDKPCFSNVKVKIGERMQREILAGGFAQAFADHAVIASDRWRIDRNGNAGWRRSDSYTVHGAARDFVEAYRNNKGLASYRWRLHAIRQFALALRDDPAMHRLIGQLADWQSQPAVLAAQLKPWSCRFAARAGQGWGVTTVYHLLTDLGVAIKPDLHVMASVACLTGGMADGTDVRSGKPTEHEAVLHVLELARRVGPDPELPAAGALRVVDKVLMEWSRHRLACPA
jgi:hypothetical protein